MHVQFSCQPLPIGALSLSSTWDIHPFLDTNAPILQAASSIKRLGQVYLPFVHQQENGGYEPVTGTRVLSALRDLGTIDTVQCRVLPTHIENENLLNCIYEEYSSRIGQLSPIEMAHFHALCERDLDEEQRELYYAANDIPGKPHLVRRALDLLKLSPAMQAGLHTGALAENSARELLRLKPADRDACFQLFQTLQLGGGKQRRMLMLLRDLAGRNGCTISDFIDSPVIKEVLEHHEMNTPQKAHSLLQQLQKLQSPTLSEAEEQFERWRAQLPLSGNCTIEHSTSFEQDQVTLRMTFENRSGLERALPTINSVLQDPED